jgi:hypothetical protein
MIDSQCWLYVRHRTDVINFIQYTFYQLALSGVLTSGLRVSRNQKSDNLNDYFCGDVLWVNIFRLAVGCPDNCFSHYLLVFQ